jgi:hypothetical protein
MKQNMGNTDRVIRTVLAILVIVLFVFKQLSGLAAVILGIFALAFLITSFTGFCPLYGPLRISTQKKAK